MAIGSEMFEHTETIRTAAAKRGVGARLVAAFGRVGHPLVLFPLVTLLILGIIWGATIRQINVEHDTARRAAVAFTRELLGTYEAQVLRAMREIDQALKVVQYAAETKGSTLALAELQERALLPPNLVFVVSLVDSRGRVVASSDAALADSVIDIRDLARLPYRTSAESQRLRMDQPHRDPQSHEWRLQFGRRVTAPDGSFAGFATLAVDAAYFVSGYDPAKLGVQGVLGLLSTDGIFGARRSGDAVRAGDVVDYASVVKASAGDDDAVVALEASPWDRVRRYTSARELYEFPVAVVVGLSEHEQLAGAARSERLELLRAAIASAVVILLAGVLGRLSWQLMVSRRREREAAIAHAERVEYLAYHDGLSGLPNRSLFSKLLRRSIKMAHRYKRRLAVLFLDLDRFKQINDTLGHEAGDELLKEVARRLKGCLRDTDTVARLGGDEFVVLLPELGSANDAAVAAQKILTVLADPFVLVGQEFRVTASIGICAFPEDGEDEQTLTKHADIAMYQAKEDGRNNFRFYSEQLNANSLERLTLESSLRHALQRGEFVLDYQAKRDIRSGRITGVESLLRWQHPDLGLVAPMKFIPLAEETGLIVPIGKWVLKAVCRQNVAWQKQGLANLSVAVNLTTRQFTDENLLQDLSDILQETGMRPQLLELEISESLLIRDVDKTLQIMTALKAMGVKIAVDDFGMCYASLSTLRQFPLDSIKIDRSFVRDVTVAGDAETHSGRQYLADAIIAMGHGLSLTVVAQGVETKDQADYLRSHACDEVQGFYFNRPLATEQITELLRHEEESNLAAAS